MKKKIFVSITDHREDINSTIKWQIEGIKNGVNMVIIRGYDRLSDIKYICAQLNLLKKQYNFKLIINAYPTKELQKLKVDGFHFNVINMSKVIDDKVDLSDLGEIGVSVHSVEEIKLSEKISPDYALISPVFQPSCKDAVKTLGVTGLAKMIDEFYEIYNINKKNVPKVIALGGINKSNYLKLLNNYIVDGFAVMSAVKEIEFNSRKGLLNDM
ncbi:thiamine phosphate synthase [Oceanirhabdus sp. W0125-5]|uniref:thiamine phosphate synthase n=1 Tax=Oceanirhabdus sp. W0125-5 TaxID=2999116 RepID=UPI0022F3067B|nr:thiamine phosphate synthase [Oceanirhabdus sp. W0125-5]WBW95531.1 thiamine phosphate synthase [Oceanirhabdus sp. W0125-5]